MVGVWSWAPKGHGFDPERGALRRQPIDVSLLHSRLPPPPTSSLSKSTEKSPRIRIKNKNINKSIKVLEQLEPVS